MASIGATPQCHVLLTLATLLAACGPTGEGPSVAARDTGVAAPIASAVPCGEATAPTDSALVAIYFNCDRAPPGTLAPASRTAPSSAAAPESRLRAAIEALLGGPTPDELESGYSSYFSSRTADALIDVRISATGDTAWLNFDDLPDALPDARGVKSFLPPGVMAGLTWTVFRSFPDIDAVHFAFNGSEASFWQWLGTEPHVFTREDWERV